MLTLTDLVQCYVAPSIHRSGPADVDHGGRVVLLDDRWTLDNVAGLQRLALVHGTFNHLLCLVEVDRGVLPEGGFRIRAAFGAFGQLRALEHSEPGDAEIDQLDQ